MENQDRARFKSFILWHLAPFIIVVLVYAVLENWWIYYKPGGQFLQPYFFVFNYNVLLLSSFVFLSKSEYTKIEL